VKSSRSKYDLAYGSFLFCGLAALGIAAVSASSTNTGTAGVLGFFVVFPLGVGSLAATIVGTVLCVRLGWDPLLLVLSACSILFLVESAAGFGPTAFYNALPIAYGIGAIAVSGVWFLVLRRRRFPTAGQR
jgi:hypothetical protein